MIKLHASPQNSKKHVSIMLLYLLAVPLPALLVAMGHHCAGKGIVSSASKRTCLNSTQTHYTTVARPTAWLALAFVLPPEWHLGDNSSSQKVRRTHLPSFARLGLFPSVQISASDSHRQSPPSVRQDSIAHCDKSSVFPTKMRGKKQRRRDINTLEDNATFC